MKLHLLVVFLLLSTALLVGQTFRGTILGSVTDPSGAFVAGATVKVSNVATGLERSTVTSGDGSYRVSELPIGTYSVSITLTGFQTAVTNNVEVDVATERRVDAQLKTGQVTQTVEVSGGDLPQIETQSNDLGGVLTSKGVEDLPINGRDYTKLIFLNAGVAGSPDQITDSPGSFGEFSMNGARGRSNNYLLDGTDMNDGYRNDPAINQGGVFAVPSAILPIGAVAEMKVLSNFQPEYGRNAGAVVNIVTKSGTNSLHGELFEYFRNDALDARNYFNTSDLRAPFHNNQFGGSLGGPIVKGKTFFYANYEGQREAVGTVTLACVPEPNRIAFDVTNYGADEPCDRRHVEVLASAQYRNAANCPTEWRSRPDVESLRWRMPKRSQCVVDHPFVQQPQQRDRKDRPQFQPEQYLDRPLFLWRQHPIFPASPDSFRRPAPRL